MAQQQNSERRPDLRLAPSSFPFQRVKACDLKPAKNFPAEFWDNLDRIWLTPRALREFDRRNRLQPTLLAPKQHTTDLARFARGGGPDTSDLRGVRDSPLLRYSP
jgi:hypothetical protein